jgi:hypothetical protein
VKPHSKTFETIEADVDSPDLKSWQIDTPKVGTTDWLKMVLNGAHDHVSLAYRIRVIDSDGAVVSGQIRLVNDESE